MVRNKGRVIGSVGTMLRRENMMARKIVVVMRSHGTLLQSDNIMARNYVTRDAKPWHNVTKESRSDLKRWHDDT